MAVGINGFYKKPIVSAHPENPFCFPLQAGLHAHHAEARLEQLLYIDACPAE